MRRILSRTCFGLGLTCVRLVLILVGLMLIRVDSCRTSVDLCLFVLDLYWLVLICVDSCWLVLTCVGTRVLEQIWSSGNIINHVPFNLVLTLFKWSIRIASYKHVSRKLKKNFTCKGKAGAVTKVKSVNEN